MSKNNPVISVVVPVYNEAENVAKLVDEIAVAFDAKRYEMVFVNDASTDETASVLKSLKANYPALAGALNAKIRSLRNWPLVLVMVCENVC